MRWFTTLVLTGSILGVTGANAQGTTIGSPKPGTAAAKAEKEHPKRSSGPAANTVAIYPFGSQFSGTDAIQSALSERSRTGFQSGGTWSVLDRSSDATLKAEVDRIHSPEQFNSEVKVRDDHQLNAHYVLWGYLESARIEQSARGSTPTYNAHLNFVVRLIDVETLKSLDKTIAVTSIITDRDLLKGKALETAKTRTADAAAGALSRMFDHGKSSNTSTGNNTAGSVVLPTTQDEALSRAYDNAGLALEKWGREAATSLGVGGGTSAGTNP